MDHEYIKSSPAEKGSGVSSSDELARVQLVEQFLDSARNLDKDGSGVITPADEKAASVTGTATDSFLQAMDSVELYRNMIDPRAGEVENRGLDVSLESLTVRRSESTKVLTTLYKSREATEQLSSNFASIDKNKNDFVTSTEVSAGVQAGTISQNSAQYLASNFHSIEAASNDEWGSENDGITRDDLKAFESARETLPANNFFEGLADHLAGEPALIDEFINDRFDQIDLNTDDHLSRSEMNFAALNKHSNLSQQEKDLVGLLIEHDEIFEFKHAKSMKDSEPLLSKSDMTELSDAVEGRADDQQNLLTDYLNSPEFVSDRNGYYNSGTGAGILAGGTIGGAIGVFAAGPVGLVPGVPIGVLTGGIGGGLAGHYGSHAALERSFNNRYEQTRLPALTSFREQYQQLRQK